MKTRILLELVGYFVLLLSVWYILQFYATKKGKLKIQISLDALGFFILLVCIWYVGQHFKTLNITFYTVRIVLIILLLICTSHLLILLYDFTKKYREWTRNLAVMCYAFAFVFLFMEIIFMFIPQSHSVGYSLAAKVWHSYYWKPINSLGYRDHETTDEKGSRKKILVIGDSFVAAQGIKKTDKRFTDLLQGKLQENARVYNLGKPGIDTRKEFNNLLEYPVKPDVIILSYFGNDIDMAASEGQDLSELMRPYKELNVIAEQFVRTSFLINFIYWNLPHEDIAPYQDFLLSSYRNHNIMKKHLSDLHRFVQYSIDNRVRFAVVIFPFMTDLKHSEQFITPVQTFCHDNGIPVLDISLLIEDIPVEQRTVNRTDAHASESVHERVADGLYQFLIDQKIVATNEAIK